VVREALQYYFEEQAKDRRSPLNEALAPQSQLIFDNKQFIQEMFDRLFIYETTERRNWTGEDFTLIGFFDIIRITLSNCP
jgi:hypothetical protein